MARIILGSSNVDRFYKAELFKEYKKYEMVRTTNLGALRTEIRKVKGNDLSIIVSMVENGISDYIKGEKNEDEVQSKGRRAIAEFFDIIQECKDKNPHASIALIKPLSRPGDKHYDANLQDWTKHFENSTLALKDEKVISVDTLVLATQKFEADGIHLTSISGKMFIDAMLMGSETLFAKSQGKGNAGTLESRLDRVEKLAKEHSEMLDYIDKTRYFDNLMTCKIREELDFTINQKKLDRVLITGLVPTTSPPKERKDLTDWTKTQAQTLISKIDKEAGKKIKFVNRWVYQTEN
jgi:hypothetical protein